MAITLGPIPGVKRSMMLAITWLLGVGLVPASASAATTTPSRATALGVSGSFRTLEIEPLGWILALETLVLADEADAGGLVFSQRKIFAI